MKFFISIVFVFSCLFTGSAWSAEYHPVPDIIDAQTESPQIGNYYKFHANFYPDPYWNCYTAQEAAAFRSLDPGNRTPMNLDMGTCQKCSAGLTLGTYNGSEVCIHDCQAPYRLGTYNGTDGCINCPVSYEFRDGACQWDGPGPPPPTPPAQLPSTPADLTASDGTSPVNVIIKWKRSRYSDYYILERAAGREEPFIWWKIGKIRDVQQHEYFDKSVRVASWYSYRIKACNLDNQCSGYSNLDKGYKALETPDPVRVETPGDNPTWVKVSWSSVPGAEYYFILIAKKENRYFGQFGFDYSDSGVLSYNGEAGFAFYNANGIVDGNEMTFREDHRGYFDLLIDKKRAIFVIAYKGDEGRGGFVSYPAVWNSSVPIYPSIRLLLFGE